MNYKAALYFLAISLFVFAGCKGDTPATSSSNIKTKKVTVPPFDGDGALAYVEKQVSFGYRVPGMESHKACKDWLVSEFKVLGADVEIQEFKASFLDVKDAESYNIIASINPKKKKRIALAAHWDTRLIADKDKTDKNKPIDGADDGASGVAVLLQIAKTLKENPIDLGVDFFLWDAEDNGIDTDEGEESQADTWCLGSQYWVKKKHDKNYKAKFGILLDMVGAKGARFPLEGISAQVAGVYQAKIWGLAQQMGYGDLFQSVKAGSITDDHLHMYYGGIPTVNIINLPTETFGHYHHTHDDNVENIDKNVLRKVGQVVTAVLYRESNNTF